MKKVLIVFFLLVSLIANSAPLAIDDKIIKNFQESFPNAQVAKWIETNDHYEVFFSVGDTKCHIWYNLQGKATQVIRYMKEESLSPFIALKIRQQFPDKHIYAVVEMTTESDIHYDITLEDSQHWYQVSSDAFGNLRAGKKYIRA